MPLPFLKKLMPSFGLFARRPRSVVGIDIGAYSTKLVQLRYEGERAILETYGELLTGEYLKRAGPVGSGFLRFLDEDIAALLKDAIRESNVTAGEAVLSIPASAGFIVAVSFPPISPKEIQSAVPLEARKYVPIPLSEVILDWNVLETGEQRDKIEVVLVAVPKDVVGKFKRIADLAGIKARALEVETFSVVRSLIGRDHIPTAIINLGHRSTTLSLVDRGQLKASHHFNRGTQELTRALERGLQLTPDRAETLKRDVGLSEKWEEKEIASVLAPLVETIFADVRHAIQIHNQKAERKIQKINLTGGGAQLKGIVELAASRLGVEVTRGNPFQRLMVPPLIQPTLREISSSFSVAVGLALHGITIR